MKKLSAAMLMAMVALSQNGISPQPNGFNFQKKARVKRIFVKASPRAGRGIPAKGYDPITKTWVPK
jgi:hypothetical protein